MKKCLLALFCITSMNCFAVEYEIILKEWAQMQQVKLKNEGHKIVDIISMDTEKHGYCKIIYQ